MIAPSASMLPRTSLYRWLAVVFVLVLVFFFHPTGSSISAYTHSGLDSNSDPVSWIKEVLKKAGVGPEISYAARTIQYIPDAKDRDIISEVDHNLLPDKFTDITVGYSTPLPAGKIVGVHVKQLSRPDDVDASTLILGVSTTLDRFNDENVGPIKEWERWLTDGKGNSNGAGLVLALLNCSDEERTGAFHKLTSVGINATVVPSNGQLDMAGRYVDLVQMLWNHPTSKQRRYFALIDDDTFFPYMSELMRTLYKYDYRRPYYIGTFTERVDWILSNHVPMAYGGGGVFLTAPVVKQISELDCLAKREDGTYFLDADQGDRLLYNCLHQKTEITLTYLPQLHQEDQFGDPSGFYESGKQPLSLHHYKSWHRVEPSKMHVVADACGEDCVLQRFQFKDNFIVSNGYSIAEYPKGIDFDTFQVEGTFDIPPDTGFVEVALSYSFGEMRKNLAHSGRKKQWEMLHSRKERDGKVKQIYIKRRADDRWLAEDEAPPERDSIIVLTWVP